MFHDQCLRPSCYGRCRISICSNLLISANCFNGVTPQLFFFFFFLIPDVPIQVLNVNDKLGLDWYQFLPLSETKEEQVSAYGVQLKNKEDKDKGKLKHNDKVE